MVIRIYEDGGFVGHNDGPKKRAPRDWIVWHFTLAANLPSIVASGGLVNDDAVGDHHNVANLEIKLRRKAVIVTAPGYPSGRSVSAHVPWYYAAKSPMLYVKRHYADDIVFLGMRVGDLVDSGLEWVASDANAAANVASFSRDLDTLGDFIDFRLMTQRDWYNTPDDQYRKSRRAAEFLVYDFVPLELISQVVIRTDDRMSEVQGILDPTGASRAEFRSMPALYY